MRYLVKQSRKGGRVCAFNQFCKSKICGVFSKIISRELNVEGNVYDTIEAYLSYKNKHFKITKEEYKNKFNDSRRIDEEEMEENINKKLGELPLHRLTQQLSFNDLLWDFDVVSLYPSAMSDAESVYPRFETGSAFIPDMNDEHVENFNTKTFTQGSAILKIK